MQEKQPSNPYYPDVAIFLALIPFISAFNYYLTYSNITVSWFLVLTFAIDTAQGYLAWWAVRAVIRLLDRRLPYADGFGKRILIQVLLTIIVGLFVIGSLTELVSWIARGQSAPLSFYTTDLFIISIWFFVINGIYIGLYFYNLWRASEQKRQEETKVRVDGLLVRQGRQDVLLTFDDVAGLFVDGDYAVVCTLAGKKFYLGQSLDKVEKTLPAPFFFRMNRQIILHRQVISGFSREENGKLHVLTSKNEFFPAEILVSRIKAPAFKQWFRPDA